MQARTRILFCLFLSGFNILSAQGLNTFDTILDAGIYKSYFSFRLKEPVYVVYKLYKGGGDCDREKFHFINDTRIIMAGKKNYAGVPGKRAAYDMGHLANAEDFAYNCVLDEMTFRFYNCLPQTPNLNRGLWKTWEATIRDESWNDSLLVICGGQFTSQRFLGISDEQLTDSIAVPDHCWKIVISLSDHKVKHILYFTNEPRNNKVAVLGSIAELEMKTGYTIIYRVSPF
jgi:endonuclease G